MWKERNTPRYAGYRVTFDIFTNLLIYSTKLDYVNRAGTSNAILREVLGIDTSIPFWAEEHLKDTIEKYLSKDFTQENLDELRREMEEIGLADFIPDTISRIVEEKTND